MMDIIKELEALIRDARKAREGSPRTALGWTEGQWAEAMAAIDGCECLARWTLMDAIDLKFKYRKLFGRDPPIRAHQLMKEFEGVQHREHYI